MTENKNKRESQRERTLRLIEQQNRYVSDDVLLGGTFSRQKKEGTGPHPRYNSPPGEGSAPAK